MEVIDANQHRLEAQMNLGNKVMEQILKDQQLLAKQIEITGQAVARLTLDRHHPRRPTGQSNSGIPLPARQSGGRNQRHT